MFVKQVDLAKKLFLAIAFSLFIFFAFRTLESHIFSIHFVDEDENIVAGYYMAQGEKLYSDIFSHKQPMPAVFSALINKILKPNSLFLFVKRHREAVFFYSIAWWLIFLYGFGLSGLIFSVVAEFSKRFLLGDLFLAESLVIFPLAFVLGCLWTLNGEDFNLRGLKKYLFLFSLVLIPFQLFVLIPFTVIVIVCLLLRKKLWTSVLPLSLFFLILFFSFLPFVSHADYLQNTKSAIMTHYFKDTISQGFLPFLSSSFLRPVTILVSLPKGDFGTLIWILSCVYLLSFTYLFFKKRRSFLLFSFFLLGATNLRLVNPQATFYQGFHGFPWFTSMIFSIIVQLKEIISLNRGSSKKKIISSFLVFFTLLVTLYSGRFLIKDYFRKVDRERDFWVNFSRFLALGRVIKTLSTDGDRLIVIPVEQLLYFTSELPHQNRFLYTYEWIFWDEGLSNELKKDLQRNSPAFVYYDYPSVGSDAKALLDPLFVNYIQLRQDDLPSNLLIRRDKLDDLQDWQIREIKNFGYAIPGLKREN